MKNDSVDDENEFLLPFLSLSIHRNENGNIFARDETHTTTTENIN